MFHNLYKNVLAMHKTTNSTTPHPMKRARRWFTVLTLLYYWFKWEWWEQINLSKNVTYCRFEIGEWHLEVEGGIEAGVGEIIETDQGEGIFKFREGKIKQIFYIFSLFKSTFI